MVRREVPSGIGAAEEDGFEVVGDPLPHRPRPSMSSTLADGDHFTSEPSIRLHALPDTNDLIVSVNPPLEPTDGGIRHVPCDIVLAIDVSGSMMTVPPLPDAGDSKEQSYLNVLDLTKHATRTVVETLNENDRLGVVVFSTEVEVIHELSYMTKEEKATVMKKVDALRPLCTTNLWHGLKKGLSVLETAPPVPENIQALYILTDGLPNHMCPTQGYISKLRQVLQEQQLRGKNLPSIHTFGFGNDIRSGLLQTIAELGAGTFSFIPDIGMLGTVFVHAVANLYISFATQTTLRLLTEESVVLSSDEGRIQLQEQASSNPGELVLNIGSLQYGQSRDILLHYEGDVKDLASVEVKMTYKFQNSMKSIESKGLTSPCTGSLTVQASEYHRSRSRVCAFLRSLFPTKNESDYKAVEPDELDGPRSNLEALVKDLKASGHTDEQNTSLIQDLAGKAPHGQAGLAISTEDYFERWGKHYLLSLLNAHTLQICNSFKDPGPLQYGKDSPLFNRCRKELDDCFDNLPAPKPIGIAEALTHCAPISMSRYNRSSNPCFAGHCMVRLAEGSESIAVQDLRAGMKVWTPRGSRCVRSIIATHVRDIVLCNIGSLSVTPWHPIQRAGGNWSFPSDVSEECIPFTGDIYSVLLDSSEDPDAHAIMVGGSVCVTLGHGIQAGNGDGDVRAHEFFGNHQRVAQSLAKLTRDSNGVLRCGGIRRDPSTGLACAFVGDGNLPNRAQGRRGLEIGSNARLHETPLPWVQVQGQRV